MLIHRPVQKENENEEENQEQIRLEWLKILENPRETQFKSNDLEIYINNEVFMNNQASNKINQYTNPKITSIYLALKI